MTDQPTLARLAGWWLVPWLMACLVYAEDLAEPPEQSPTTAEAPVRDSVDARIPKDPKVDALWDASELALRDQNWKQVIDLQQKLLDYPEDALIESAPGRWESVRTAANRVLRQAPPEVLANYEQQYGGLAAQLLQQAQGEHAQARLVEVATRYFHTPAGALAAARLSAWHFDQREFIPATQWNRELIERGWALKAPLAWRLQAALTARFAGATDLQPFLAGWFDVSQTTRVTLGDQTQTVQQWWEQVSSPLVTTPPLEEWKQFGGSNLRWAAASPEEPLLLRNWGRSLASTDSMRQRMAQLLNDINDQGLPLIPAGSPVVIGDKVAFRDLRGVQVVNRQTGKSLWRTEEGISPERILNGVPSEGQGLDNAWRVRLGAAQFDEEYFGESAEMHPLASWLFRDATNAFISSDGLRLYVLEDVAVMTRHQAGYFGEDDPEGADPFGATWSSNRLSAYDLETGRLAWTIGGPATAEAVALPLAGAFLLGVPAIDRGELYVVASTGQEVRLQALDPETGRPRWSQLLAFSDTKIELDIPRRWLSAPVAIHAGLVICPTTVGWLVAVDRTRHCIAWAQRYQPKSEDPDLDPASQFLSQQSLGDAWCVGAPLVSGNAVLLATPEVDQLLCLDLLDGHVRWSRDRKDGLYLATASAQAVVVAGQTSISAIDLANGKPLWTTKWADDEQPLGRGVRYGNSLAIPLSNDQLAVIDIETGKRLQSIAVPKDAPLGNLVKVGQQFLSLGWSGCQAFSERTHFLEDLATQQAQQPREPETLLRAARFAQLQNDHRQVAMSLADIARELWSSAQLSQRDQLLWTSYRHLARAETDQDAPWYSALEALANSPARQLDLLAVKVDRLVASHQVPKAFSLLWEECQNTPSTTEVVPRPDDSGNDVTPAVWIAGRMQTLWTTATADDRATIQAVITRQVEQARAGTIDDQLRIWPWVAEHPEAIRLSWSIAENWAQGHYLDRAEAVLRTGLAHPDLASRLETELRIARLQLRSGIPLDHRARLLKLRADHGSLTLPSGQTVAEIMREWRLLHVPAAPVSALEAGNRQHPLTMVRLPAGHQPTVQELVPPDTSPFYSTVSFQLEPDEQRLVYRDQQQGRLLGMIPLRVLAQSEDTGYSPYHFFGQRLLILHRNVLQMVSLAQRRVVWSVSVGHERGLDWEGHRQEPRALEETDDFYDEPGYWQLQNDNQGRLIFANDQGIGILEQRGFSVYDAVTGQLRWRHRRMPPYAQVVGTPDVVVVIDTQTDDLKTFRTRDGQPVEISQLADRLKRSIAIKQDDLITIHTKPGIQLFALDTRQLSIRRQNIFTGKVLWNVDVRNGSHLGKLGDDSLLIVGPSRAALQDRHAIDILDLNTGSLHSYDPVPIPNSAESLLPLIDAERLYLVINNNDYADNYGDSLLSTHVDGLVIAWDRQTGRMLWRTSVEEQNLVLDRFAESPLLVFLSREWKQVAQASYTKLRLLVLDKVTGRVRLTSESPSLFGGFHGLKVLPGTTGVELTSYNMRLRLTPQGQAADAASESPGEAAPTTTDDN